MTKLVSFLFIVLLLSCSSYKLTNNLIGASYYCIEPTTNNMLKLSFNKESTYKMKGNYFYLGSWELKKVGNSYIAILYNDNFRAEIFDTLKFDKNKGKIKLDNFVFNNYKDINDSLKIILDSLFVEKKQRI